MFNRCGAFSWKTSVLAALPRESFRVIGCIQLECHAKDSRGSSGSERVIYDIRNVHDMHDVRMIGHYWLMTS